MEQNRCPVCGRKLDFGAACYHPEKMKMTPTPWKWDWDDNGFHFIWAEEGMPRPYICASGRSDPADTNEENAAAIVAAVNATYGNGIDPDAVKGLHDALQAYIKDYEQEGGFSEREAIYNQAKAAIKKAKL